METFKNKIRFIFLNFPFRFKIIAIIVFSFIMLVITSITGIRKLQMKYDDILYKAYEQVLYVTADAFGETLDQAEDNIKEIATDSEIQSYLVSIESGEYLSATTLRSMEQKLQKYINDYTNTVIYGLCISTDKGVFFNSRFKYDYGYDYSLGTKFSEDELADIVQKVQGKTTAWLTDYNSSYGIIIAQDIRRIQPMRLDSMGCLIGCLNLEPILNKCSKLLQQEKCYFVLLDENRQPIYSYNNTEKDITFLNQVNSDNKYSVVKQDKSSYFVISGNASKNNWEYIYAIPYGHIEATIRQSTADIVLTMCLCIMISLLVTGMILRQILRDFKELMSMIDDVSDIDFKSVELSELDMKRTDEIGVLMRRFIRMSKKIDNLIRDNYESRLLCQETKLQALEMQINPHFLYNTLESVRCCAKLGQNDDVCRIVEGLGNIVHQIMSNLNNEVHLEEELRLIDDYIAIQKIRFDQRLSFVSTTDPDCNNAVMPKLTLLAIIENAVVHGVEKSSDVCRIVLETCKKDGQVYVYVKNTGSSFVENFYNKLSNGEITPSGHGIGLLNVDGRMKLYFQDEYHLRLYNEDMFAVVELKFPYWETRNRRTEIQNV